MSDDNKKEEYTEVSSIYDQLYNDSLAKVLDAFNLYDTQYAIEELKEKVPQVNIKVCNYEKFNTSTDITEKDTIYVSEEFKKMKIGDGVTPLCNLASVDYNIVPDTISAPKGLGCMLSPHDERDYQFTNLCALDNTVYPEEYIPKYEPRFFDQGESSMCCACACAMSRYIYELNDSHNNKLLSPTYIYGNRCNSTVIDGIYTGEGMFLKDALKQLCAMGTCYNDTIGEHMADYEECNRIYSANSLVYDEEAHPFRTSSYYVVNTIKEVKRAIMLTGSVLAAYSVTYGWYFPKTNGTVANYGPIEGGHAILLTGWKVIDGKEHWIIHNSWGTSWGDKGYGYISTSEKFMEAYCIIDRVKEINLLSDIAVDYKPED